MLVAMVGIILTIVYLIGYFRRREKVKLRNAVVTFIGAAVLFSTLVIIAANKYPDKLLEKEVVLVAAREASFGGILLRLYADSTFEIGDYRKMTSTGMYALKGDTLVITNTDTSMLYKDLKRIYFVIKEGNLEEVKGTGIGVLEIHENSLE